MFTLYLMKKWNNEVHICGFKWNVTRTIKWFDTTFGSLQTLSLSSTKCADYSDIRVKSWIIMQPYWFKSPKHHVKSTNFVFLTFQSVKWPHRWRSVVNNKNSLLKNHHREKASSLMSSCFNIKFIRSSISQNVAVQSNISWYT